MIKILRNFVALALLIASPAWAALDRAEYSLTFGADSLRRFHVDADLPVAHGELVMASPVLAEPLPNGWADFIENLSARDVSGRAVSLTHLGSGRWKLDRQLKRVKLSYDVALKHDDVRWAISGLFARGYAVDDAAFFFGHVAFISGDTDFKNPAHIRFKIPKGWQIATAFPQVKGRKGVYQAEDWEELRLSGSMVGNLAHRHFEQGPLEVVVSGPKNLEPIIAMIGDPLRSVIAGYAHDMGGAPPGKFGFFFAIHPNGRGGETTDNTISMMLPKPPDADAMGDFTYVIAHEIFHLWNAVAIAPEDYSQSYWFSEGFSVYGAMLELYRSNIISEEQFLKDKAAGYDKYLSGYRKAAGTVSLQEAGQDKAKHNDLIYYGGMAAAIALDIEGRSRCGAANGGFAEMMRLAHDEFGKTGKRYKADDLVRLASQATGTDMGPFFERYIHGNELIPLADYLKRAGLILSTVEGKSSITRDPSATAAQRRLYPPPARTASQAKR